MERKNLKISYPLLLQISTGENVSDSRKQIFFAKVSVTHTLFLAYFKRINSKKELLLIDSECCISQELVIVNEIYMTASQGLTFQYCSVKKNFRNS